ncbi:hypothetical protein BDN72DRAFT_843363 [Pluteus cervinus]|uniref:Uncharacterized protein n=1 Tax=Pluteus cervinus TaxID=181527 RepID=A0ACD3ANX0_9AGAR|nr:hypothetical protein BDN72DRAFT_843363 [Pluteus cervinus]
MDTPPPIFDPNLVATLMESLIFGMYTWLFFRTWLISRRNSLRRRSPAANVFQQTTVVLYVLAAFHVSVSLYRVLQGFVYTPADVRMGYWYEKRWEHITYFAVHSIMSWIGQALLIYRCFLIYGSNWLIVTPSIILWLFTVGVSLFCNYLWNVPNIASNYSNLLNSLIPLTLAQHVMTPVLTVFRLLRQHHESRVSGLQDSNSRINLRTVSMVILESTMIYVVLLITTVILQIMGSENRQIPTYMSPPTLGVCFSLITIRLHNLSLGETREKSIIFTIENRLVQSTTDAEDTPTPELRISESRSELSGALQEPKSPIVFSPTELES